MELKILYPGIVILKNDSSYIQGIPDLIVLYKNKWVMLECKRSAKSKHQPNQDYYVGMLNEMSYAAFIYPENKEQILYEMERLFTS